ncbi:hypothetical protein COV93_00805 [Candidatus Woesearchaeota archaeon CG11_big_fil_rev_8_21_14_0_20_43_8]|nr:MAG: hypothetical protein COV93_00805 [Candidatus Woesearchaeota archaeon CG11_big_fil_rev_8_21_14_0_20_43_8]
MTLDNCPAIDRDLEEIDLLESDTIIGGRYKVEDLFDTGGLSLIYRCIDLESKTTMALKCVDVSKKKRLMEETDIALDDIFDIEVSVLSKVSHPGIVGSEEPVEHCGRLYLPLEFLGQNFLDYQKILFRTSKDPRRQLIKDLLGHIVPAMNYLYQRNISHNDIKPLNIRAKFEHGNHWLKLIDFGFAIQFDQSHPFEGIIQGTLEYLPPEFFLNKKRKNADVYSFGRVLCNELVMEARQREPRYNSIEITLCVPEIDDILKSIYSRDGMDLDFIHAYNKVHKRYPSDLIEIVDLCLDRGDGEYRIYPDGLLDLSMRCLSKM